METNEQDKELEMLEQLEVIESHELKVGNAFHSFRFSTVTTDPSGSNDSMSEPKLLSKEDK